ncbi:MAG TPA: O-antigen ligase family protein [Bacillus sp. (in: firmicutes)]|nr:O-antigen ligase family protein [Bacillus sp. (in: firmicutes)]
MTYNFRIHDYWFYFLGILVIAIALFLPANITLVVISGLAVILAWVKPKQALLLMALYIPIRTFLVEINDGFTLTGDLITFILLLKVLWETKGEIRSWFRFHPFEIAFFIFLIVGAVGGYLTGATLSAVIFQVRTFLIMYVIYYIVSRMNLNKEDYIKFGWVTVMTSTIICIHGLIEKLSFRQWLLPESWSEAVLSVTNAMRIYGLLNNPNSLAIYLSISAIVTLYLLQKVTGTQRKVLYCMLVLFFGVFMLTFSRGTLIALAIGLIIFFAFTRHWQLLRPILISAIASLIVIYFPVTFGGEYIGDLLTGGDGSGSGKGSGGFKERIDHTFDEESLELMAQSGRIFYIKKGFEIFLDHPIAGTGFATFGDSATLTNGSPIYDDYNINTDIYGFNFYTDNQYIGVITQTGVIGVVLFAIFLLGMLWIFWQRRQEDPSFSYIMIALWFATAVMGMIYNIWELKLFTFFYFLFFGAYASRHNIYRIKR